MPNVIQIYTDGACSNNYKGQGLGGYGVVMLCDGKEKRLQGYINNATNNIAEITAVIKALEEVNPAFIANHKGTIEIYSDSAYVVNCINQKWYKRWLSNGWRTAKGAAVENKELWCSLLTLVTKYGNSIKFIKVAGHSNDYYNEQADFLARGAIEQYLKEQQCQ